MNSEELFIVRKVWEFVEQCAEQRGRCRWVRMTDFWDALDSWGIGKEESYTALRQLEGRYYLVLMTRGEEGAITDIVITPETYRCPDCRLMVCSRQDLEDHLPDCLRQQAKLRRIGLIT